MKKHLKSLLVLAVIMPCIILFSACGSMANGTYKLDSISVSSGGINMTIEAANLADLFGETEECSSCDGTGICGDCEGTFICEYCKGIGYTECGFCEGTGDNDGDECWFCDGTGEDDCFMCDATGECYHCAATGECSICDGTGEVAGLGSIIGAIFGSMSFVVKGDKITIKFGEEGETYKYTLKNDKVTIKGMEVDEDSPDMVIKYKNNKITMSSTIVEEGVSSSFSIVFKKV